MSLDKEEIKKKIIDKLQNNPIIGHACKNAGVVRSSFYRLRDEDPIFDKAVKDAQRIGRAVTCDAAESKILNLINSDNEDIALKASKIILNTYNHNYQENDQGINYQKARLKDAIERMEQENHEMLDGYSDMLKSMIDIVKADDDPEKANKLKDSVNKVMEKLENINKKNIFRDEEREGLKKLI
jgi:hypothetical protein